MTPKIDLKIIVDTYGNKLMAKTIIWANVFEMSNRSKNVPKSPISAHVTYLISNELTLKLQNQFCCGHYFFQAFRSCHQIGASFNRNANMASKKN